MSQEEKKKIHKKITIISLTMLVVVLAVMFIGIFSGRMSVLVFQLIAAAYLICYWALTDLVEPKMTKVLTTKEPEQLTAYKKYVATDLIGYLGLFLFVFTVGVEGASSYGLFGVVVYALTMSAKRKYRQIFVNPVSKKSQPQAEKTEEKTALEEKSEE
jgi:hypothetical protein